MQMYYVHLSLVYAFLHAQTKIKKEDLYYCIDVCKDVLQKYLALENEDLAAMEHFDVEENQDQPLITEEIVAQKAQILIRKK
ncbi:MAG: hypothetical protein R3A45_08530 [Bdellovibrionota bacterium]